uniref:Gypsy retrotransposon integrase-like protein 1 n=1 Tax=Nothobranchius furzeri TaxID=105023 RepID=A0A8C6M0L4_NOTFU
MPFGPSAIWSSGSRLPLSSAIQIPLYPLWSRSMPRTSVPVPSCPKTGPDDRLHPCAYFSRKFSTTQQKYGVDDCELLAIKWALEEWREWLLGATQPFTIWTDHQNLTHIHSAKQLNPRQARWALFFEPYELYLAYRPGTKYQKVDALSRQFSHSTPTSEPALILPDHRFLAPLRWPLEETIQHALRDNPAPPETPTNRLYVPTSCRSEVVSWAHSSPMSGHAGFSRTLTFLQRALWWPHMAKDVKEYTSACDICAHSKTPSQAPVGVLRPLPVPSHPWSHVGLDFVTGLPPVNYLNTVLTVTDRFSKAVLFIALPGLPSAQRTAELFLENVVRLHGFPVDVFSDRGPQFTARFWKAFCRLMGASGSLSSGYHPQTNVQTERVNQQLGRYLRCFVSAQPSQWPKYLLWAELSHNLHTSSTTHKSPFEVCYGHQPPVFARREPEVAVPAAKSLVRRCKNAWIKARASITRANARYAHQHLRRHRPCPSYVPGVKVWVTTTGLRLRARSKKLAPRFLRPYTVQKVINPVSYRLRLPPSLRIHPTFHTSLLKPYVESSLLPPPALAPLPARFLDGEPIYTARRVLDARRRG